MKLRIKNTPFWGETTGNMGGTVNNPLIELRMRDGSTGYYSKNELTEKTISESAHEFMFSVFAESGSRKNQIIFFSAACVLAFLVGLLIL